jgi:hypothetical protein
MRAAIHIALVAVAMLWCSRPAIADDADFKIIVHPESSIDHIDRTFLRNAFLKKTSTWASGKTIRPIGLTSKFPARTRFVSDVLKKTTAQLKSYWNQQIFSGKGIPPPESDSVASVVAYVLANQGAVAFVPANADVGKAKIIRID